MDFTGKLVQVSLPYATFGLVIRDGRVSAAPPVARWAAGKHEAEVAGYYRRRGAVLTVLAPSLPLPGRRVRIDLNVRVRGGQTFAGLEDADGPVAPGDAVEVYEPEPGVAGPGTITDVDSGHGLIYIAVDRASPRAR